MKHLVKIFALLTSITTLSFGQQTPFYEAFDNGTIQGVKGNAQVFDGYTTSKKVLPTALPKSDNLTIEAWIAVQEYADNVAAIADREANLKTGYLFGINQYGKLSAALAVNNQWITCISETAVPLLTWTHVALTIENGKAMTLYINGKKSGSTPLTAAASYCDTCALSIGKTQTATTAANTERPSSKDIKTHNFFDGLIDEFYAYPSVSSEPTLSKRFTTTKPTAMQPLKFRQMPSGGVGNGSFGAFYTQLKYAPAWDALWRGSEYPDIVVRFDNSPVRFIFWRGTGYIPAIVNEHNMWMTDQSLEHWGTGECYEAMGDKQTRYSHVRIIENSPARVVIHWRYALAGIKHQLLHVDDYGWGDWADEYWTIYPDGVAARKQVLWSKAYETDKGTMQWQETIFFNQPGTKPQDNVDMEAITFMDMSGKKAAYSWKDGPPKKFETPQYKPIEMVNFKVGYKPFSIFEPKRITRPYSFGNREEYTTIPNWNHWPVQQSASDGRNVVAPDKPSHSSLTDSNGKTWNVEKVADGQYQASSLKGMTNQPIDSLMGLAKSWNNAPSLLSTTNALKSIGYDKYQRAFVLKSSDAAQKQISFTIQASEESPLYNLPLVVENWQANAVKITCENQVLTVGKDVLLGNIGGLEQDKAVFFFKIKRTKPVTVTIERL